MAISLGIYPIFRHTHSVPEIHWIGSKAPISKTRFLACGGAMFCSGDVFFAKAAGINKKAAAGFSPLNALNALRHENQEGKRVRKFTV